MVILRPRHTSPNLEVNSPTPKVRDVVELLWEDREQSFRGRLVKRVRPKDNVFLVSYDDGDELWHDLDEHYWRPAGTNDWVIPSVFADAKPSSSDVGDIERSQPKAKRKRISREPLTPKSKRGRVTNTPKKAIKRSRSNLPRKLPEESSSKNDKLSLKNRINKSSAHAQSDVSTQLSSSKASGKEIPVGTEVTTAALTADTSSKTLTLTAVQPVHSKQNSSKAITTSSIDSADKKVPPRKRKSYLSL